MSMMQDNLLRPARFGRPSSPLDSAHVDPVDRVAEEPVRVIIRQSVLNAIHEHGRSNPNIEVCGVIVGDIVEQDDGVVVVITNHIRGEGSTATAGSVTFTAETWTHIHLQMDQRFAEMKIVGWYHTHPGFGIFLSPMDMFIQENFFNVPWQVALVHDPVSMEQGVFAWQKGRVERCGFEIHENVRSAVRVRRRHDHGHSSLVVWFVLAVVLLAMSAVAFTWANVNAGSSAGAGRANTTGAAPAVPGGPR